MPGDSQRSDRRLRDKNGDKDREKERLKKQRQRAAKKALSQQQQASGGPGLSQPAGACTERSERSERSEHPLALAPRSAHGQGAWAYSPSLPPGSHSHALALRLPVARVRVARSVHDPCMSA